MRFSFNSNWLFTPTVPHKYRLLFSVCYQPLSDAALEPWPKFPATAPREEVSDFVSPNWQLGAQPFGLCFPEHRSPLAGPSARLCAGTWALSPALGPKLLSPVGGAQAGKVSRPSICQPSPEWVGAGGKALAAGSHGLLSMESRSVW